MKHSTNCLPAIQQCAPFKRSAGDSGFTIAEVTVSAGLLTVLFAALVIVSVFVQRSLNASLHYAERQAQQLQVTDYLARDLRNAKTVTRTVAGDTTTITIKVPQFYSSNGDRRIAKLDNHNGITYGPDLYTITYTFTLTNGVGTLRRASNLPHDQADVVLADQLEGFQASFDSQEDTVMARLTFKPKYSWNDAGSATIRDGTLAFSNTMRRNKN